MRENTYTQAIVGYQLFNLERVIKQLSGREDMPHQVSQEHWPPTWLLCPHQAEMDLLDVTQKGHTSQDPVIWGHDCSQIHHGDEGQVSSPRFLVNRTHVQLGVLGRCGINGEDVQHGQLREEHLGGGFRELPVPSVPGCSIQVQPINIHTFLEEPSVR